MDQSHESLGSRIAALRDRKGWIQRQLAEKAGISVTFLSEVENDKRKVSADVLLRIAGALGTSLDYLMVGETKAVGPSLEERITIPPALAAAAEEQGWSYKDTMALYQGQQAVVARRSRTGEAVGSKTLSKQDWIAYHNAVIAHGESQE